MSSPFWRRWFKSKQTTVRGTGAKAQRSLRYRPWAEVLEDRTLLAAPVVSALNPAALLNQSSVPAWGTTTLKVSFSKTPVNAAVASNYILSGAGADGIWGNSD